VRAVQVWFRAKSTREEVSHRRAVYSRCACSTRAMAPGTSHPVPDGLKPPLVFRPPHRLLFDPLHAG